MATRRRNPFSFDLDPEAARIAREDYPRWRSIASLTSPIKHRAITEDPRVAQSPHNFHVAVVKSLGGSVARGAEPHGLAKLVASHIRPNAVTLIAAPLNVAEMGQNLTPRQKGAESLYTAFVYLHRLGDELTNEPPNSVRVITGGIVYLGRFRNAQGQPLVTWRNPWRPSAEVAHAQAALGGLWRTFVQAAGGNLEDPVEVELWEDLIYTYVAAHVDSKMVREGYASDATQAIADLFPLAELTTKPLLRPANFDEVLRRTEADAYSSAASLMVRLSRAVRLTGRAEEEIIDMLNAYGAQFDILWRRWYNALIPTLYGTGVVI